MQRRYAQIRSLVSRHHGRWTRFAKDNVTLCGVQDERPRFKRRNPIKPQMTQNIAGATSTGENGGMRWTNSMFCNKLINYAVGIVSVTLKFVHANHREYNSYFERRNFRLQKIFFCPISNFENKVSPASDE